MLKACKLTNQEVKGHFVNHWDRAIEIHQKNHPEHEHYTEDIFIMDPAAVFPPETDCVLLWGSPQCTFFSRARGAACVNEQDRSHAWKVVDWIRHLRPEGVMIENVKEFKDWCRLKQKRDSSGELMWAKKGKPVKLTAELQRLPGESEEKWRHRLESEGFARYEVPDLSFRGEFFEEWKKNVEDLGYVSDHRILCSADFGDPTIRQRLFVYFVRKDSGKKIVWPDPVFDREGRNGLPLWKSARDHVIDWSIKGSSIFNRKKPMAANTVNRIVRGLVKYGMTELIEGVGSSCLVPKDQGYDKKHVLSVDSPISTVQTKAADFLAEYEVQEIEKNLAQALLMTIDQTGGGRNHGCYPTEEPLRTLPTKANAGLVEISLDLLERNLSSLVSPEGVGDQSVQAFLESLVRLMAEEGKIAKPWVYVYYSSGSEGLPIDSPLPTVRTKEGIGLCYPVIELDGRFLRIDVLFRMLNTRELQRSMGFPDDLDWDGASSKDIVKAIGNSVSQGLAKAMGLAWLTQNKNVFSFYHES